MGPLGAHAAAHILDVSGSGNAACETPRLDQTAAAEEEAWRCCETSQEAGAELRSSTTSTEQHFRSSSCGAAACRDSEAAPVQAAPGRVSKAAAAAVQVLISYLDKALGLRVQGMVAEVSLHGASLATTECLAACLLLWCLCTPRAGE